MSQRQNKIVAKWGSIYKKTLIGLPDPQIAFIVSAILVLTNSNVYVNEKSKVADLFCSRGDGFERQIYLNEIKRVFNLNVKGDDLLIDIGNKISMEGLWVK